MTTLQRAIDHIKRTRDNKLPFLDLGWLLLESLPEELGNLPDLRVLSLSKRAVWQKGQELTLEDDQERPVQLFTNVDGLRGLPNLQTLYLLWCGSLRNVDGLRELPNLQTLDLTGCGSLKNVDGLRGLPNLQTLYLSCCGSLKNVNGLRGLPNLQTLDLSRCGSLKNVNDISGLPNLQTLHLSSCDSLKSVDSLRELPNLQTLSLNGCNSLTNVHGLRQVPNLQVLHLTWCESLRNVDGLRGLVSLLSLDLAGCTGLSRFTALCEHLEYLQELHLYGCVFQDLPRQICGESFGENVLDSVRAYYADSVHGLKSDDELKVFVLGNGGVGKTQLCRCLRGESFQKKSSSTLGIEVSDLTVHLPGHAPVRLNLWDFGGQDIYLGTHHLFLHKQAIFILLFLLC